jgi:hypothetical protein
LRARGCGVIAWRSLDRHRVCALRPDQRKKEHPHGDDKGSYTGTLKTLTMQPSSMNLATGPVTSPALRALRNRFGSEAYAAGSLSRD